MAAYFRSMLERSKVLLRPFVPKGVRELLGRLRASDERRSIARTEQALGNAPGSNEWLGRADLEKLCAEFPFPPAYGYGEDAFEKRGNERAAQILGALPDQGAIEFLDLACLDGMTAAVLQRQGKRCWAVDLEIKNIDPRARAAGVQVGKMDAMALDFPADRFDAVYSFNAFEHFADPTAALNEALRVTKPGGHVFLHFGPLYGSAKGMHAYYHIPVPYCQFLFPLDMMNAYLRERGSQELDPHHCNRWTVRQFRELWSSALGKAEIVESAEFRNTGSLELVQRYPSCFKGKIEGIDDLLVNIMHIVLRKR